MADPTPAEQSAASSALMARLLAGQDPHARGVSAPPDQKYVAWFDDKDQLHYDENLNFKSDAPKTTVYGSADSGYFHLDANGNAVVDLNPNPDALVTKAVERQGKEAERNERQKNSDAGKGYATDAELAKMQNDARQTGVSEGQLQENIRQFDIKQRAQDAKDKVDAAKVEQDIKESAARVGQIGAQTGLIGAQTTKTGAETGLTNAQAQALVDKTPSEIKEAIARAGLAGAQADLAEQQVADLKQKAKQPSIVDLGQGPTYATQAPSGQITEQMRQGYVPKTLAEVEARKGQIQAAANAKMAELNAKVNGTDYTHDQALKDFSGWYDQNVQPYQDSLIAAQQQAIADQAKDQASARSTAYGQALQAAQNVTQAYQAQAPYMVGPRAAEVANQVAKQGNLRGVDFSNAAFYKMPDIQGMQQAAVADALKYISPTAAAMTGQPTPNYQGTDIAAGLARTNWMAPQPAPAPQPASQPNQGQPAVTVTVQGQGQGQPQDQGGGWQRADQSMGPTPAGNALAPMAGMAGTVDPNSPVYLGTRPRPPTWGAGTGTSFNNPWLSSQYAFPS